MKRKLYFSNEECAYDIGHWQDEAEERQEPVIVELAKTEIHGEMWCNHLSDFVERGCSYGCDAYIPRNGISGRCRSYSHGLIGTGKKFLVHPGHKKVEPMKVKP